VKIAALAFVVFMPHSRSICGCWTSCGSCKRSSRLSSATIHVGRIRALLLGRLVAIAAGTAMAASQGFASIYPLYVGGAVWPGYAAVYAFIANAIVTAVFTLVFDTLRVPRGGDETSAADYDDTAVEGAMPMPAMQRISSLLAEATRASWDRQRYGVVGGYLLK